MATPFSGIPGEGLDFLRDLAEHNDRAWFQAHKAIYERSLRRPMLELVEAVNDGLAQFAPAYRVDPAKALSRPHRDTRFSADKRPYRTDVAVVLPRGGAPKHAAAGYYFAVSPAGVEVIGGAYMPGPEELNSLRRHLAAETDRFRRIVADPELRESMGELRGEALKRVPAGWPADHPAGDLLRLKQAYFSTRLEPATATSPGLAGELLDRFRRLVPFVEFLDEGLAGAGRSPSSPAAQEARP